jgi:integrase
MGQDMAFSAKAIESLSTGKLPDPATAGLFIEVSGGAKMWRYRRRVAGTDAVVKASLGAYPAHTLAMARKWANGLNDQAERGIDPKAEQRARQAAKMTVEAAHALYMAAVENGERRRLKPRTITDKRTIWLRDMAPHIGPKRLHDLTADDLWDMVEAKGAVAPVRANRMAAEAKVFFAWCVSREGQRAGVRLTIDPAASLNGKHYAESKGRARFLSDDEIGWLLVALAQENGCAASTSYRRAFLLMLLTGARIGEVKGAPAAEVRAGIWTIAAERAKNGQAHSIRLGAWGRAIAEAQGDWLIPHPNGGTINSEVWYEVRDRLHARMERLAKRTLEPWAPHDLRRTLRSNTFALGIRFEVAEAMLNHARKGLERRYDVSDLSAQMAEGWAAWEAKLVAIARAQGVGDVLGLPALSAKVKQAGAKGWAR